MTIRKASALLAGFLLVLASAGVAPLRAQEESRPGEEGSPGDGTAYVRIKQLSLPLVRGKGPRGYLFVSLELVTDNEHKLYVTQNIPRLQDAFVVSMNAHSVTMRDDPGAVDIILLKRRLRALSERVLGKGAVSDVLVTRIYRGG